MREIKFRAWSKAEGAFIAGFNMVNFHSYFNKGVEPHIFRYSNEWKLSDIELMQYTGLKDKNGKEIYEGDIVLQVDEISGEVDQLAPVVRNSNVNWSWSSFGNIDSALDVEYHPSTEIIGNIYENPEMINEPLANFGSQKIDAPQDTEKKDLLGR